MVERVLFPFLHVFRSCFSTCFSHMQWLSITVILVRTVGKELRAHQPGTSALCKRLFFLVLPKFHCSDGIQRFVRQRTGVQASCQYRQSVRSDRHVRTNLFCPIVTNPNSLPVQFLDLFCMIWILTSCLNSNLAENEINGNLPDSIASLDSLSSLYVRF